MASPDEPLGQHRHVPTPALSGGGRYGRAAGAVRRKAPGLAARTYTDLRFSNHNSNKGHQAKKDRNR